MKPKHHAICAALAFVGGGAYNGFFTDEGFLSQENCIRAQQPLLGFGVFRARKTLRDIQGAE
jgi:hypothetical protein